MACIKYIRATIEGISLVIIIIAITAPWVAFKHSGYFSSIETHSRQVEHGGLTLRAIQIKIDDLSSWHGRTLEGIFLYDVMWDDVDRNQLEQTLTTCPDSHSTPFCDHLRGILILQTLFHQKFLPLLWISFAIILVVAGVDIFAEPRSWCSSLLRSRREGQVHLLLVVLQLTSLGLLIAVVMMALSPDTGVKAGLALFLNNGAVPGLHLWLYGVDALPTQASLPEFSTVHLRVGAVAVVGATALALGSTAMHVAAAAVALHCGGLPDPGSDASHVSQHVEEGRKHELLDASNAERLRRGSSAAHHAPDPIILGGLLGFTDLPSI